MSEWVELAVADGSPPAGVATYARMDVRP